MHEREEERAEKVFQFCKQALSKIEGAPAAIEIFISVYFANSGSQDVPLCY